ncbi:MAG: xanthine dehydrogenase family protein molybdopterin-binding subunit [Nitratireductor sp.]|nr:xanthine dehydrogenase family protein molybdopterin-binding subunit [Nitratireductor sp.]
MSKLGTITRRSFLIGSAAIAGGVAFGWRWYNFYGENPMLEDLPEGDAALTPYVLITAEGITLITPRMDMGQGAYSVQAALIAEELDVDLAKVTVDPGKPAPIYYNTALSSESVPFPSTDRGTAANALRSIMDGAMKAMGMQITGGSTTVADQFEKLRYAGAVARETLKQAAAQKTGTAAADLKTADGKVILPDGSTLSYEELAPLAAKTKLVAEVTLRDPSKWRYLGKPMQRIDIVAKSTGTQSYGIDMRLDGMLHATVKRNPNLGEGLKSYDASEAEKIRGVQKVVPITDGVGVVASNTWAAFKGAEAVTFEWEKPAYPQSQEGHWQALSDSFNDDHLDSRDLDKGDVEAATQDNPLTAEYRAPYLAHAPLEPLNATVLVTAERIDVWAGTQVPRFVENQVAKVTGYPVEKIHVHVQMAGGSFGHRLETDQVVQAAETAMHFKGTPVKTTYSREEDFAQEFARQIAMARMKGKASGGKVEAFDLSIAMPSVIASQMGRQGLNLPGPDRIIPAGAWDQPYAIPNYRMSAYRAPQLAPVSSWRSVGASTNAFFHEGFLDELIHAAGADPMEERLRLIWHDESRKVLEAVAEMSGWGGKLPAGTGRGVAFSLSFGTPVAEVVQVADTPDGIRIEKVWVAAETGPVVDPVNFENLVQGGVIWGLGHAMNCELTIADGVYEQSNFDSYQAMRISQCPEITVKGLENSDRVRGIGEPPVPPAAPALANAIFAATGKRLREMPFNKFVDFA